MEGDSSKTLFMSTFPPRHCGIATFTRDLTDSIDKNSSIKTKVIAINEPEADYDYSEKVMHRLKIYDYEDHISIAEKINTDSSVNLVCLQHEFGIYGGEQSCHPIPFLEKLKKPSIITFHSVFPNPTDEVYSLVRSIAKRVNKIIVMTDTAVKLLREDYKIDTPIEIIPHGIPEVKFESQNYMKLKFGLADRAIISSFGMVGPGKGYEHVIESLPEVVKKFPNALYIIVGATHPGVVEEEGETYRDSLVKKIKKLGLENNVAFHNAYLPLPKIIEYIKASDIFISSNQNPEQITSGTLAYAMGCGRAIISTPYPHAQDVVKGDNGLLVDYDNSEKYTRAIISLLSNQDKLRFIERNNYQKTRSWTWSNVGKAYGKLIQEITSASSSHFSQQPQNQFHTYLKAPRTFQNAESF